MMKIRMITPPRKITAQQFKAATQRGLQNVKQFLVGNKGNQSGLIQREMAQPKTGKAYIVYRNGKKKIHIASSANGKESSAILTGNLKNSVDGRVEGSNRLIISANTPYARIQEKGGLTSKGGRIAPRNNLRRPTLSNRGQIKNIISRELNNLK